MLKRDELIDHVYALIGQDVISKAKSMDELPNGVQFLGSDQVETVTLGVSLNEAFLQEAVQKESNFSVFHHAFDPRTYKSIYSSNSQKRLKLIFQNQFTIMGFHAALDIHPTLGNNAQIIKKLGASIKDPFFDNWGYTAEFSKALSLDQFESKLKTLFGKNYTAFISGPDQIKSLAVCSGAAKPYAEHIEQMNALRVQAYLSGETSESRPHVMMEEGINYFLCGHYATEVFGVLALGKALSDRVGDRVIIEFIDIPNPI